MSKAQNVVQIWLKADSKVVPTGVSFLGKKMLINLVMKYN